MAKGALTVDQIRNMGVLQEINRQLLHPRGMALELETGSSGDMRIVRTTDPEGFLFDWSETDQVRAALAKGRVFEALVLTERRDALGFVIEPLPETPDADA